MPGPYGLTSTGFNPKPLDQIISDMEQIELAEISPSLNVQPEEPIGVLNGIMAQAIAELWQLAAALYNGMDPDQATQDQLTALALITGTSRLGATQTQVIGCTVNIAASFVTAAPGTVFASVVNNPSAIFMNKETITYPGGGGNQNVTVDFEAVLPGPTQCLAGTLTTMAQPLTGWNSITNPTDGVIGTNGESDADLRARREQELSNTGATTADAIKADVLKQLVSPTTTSDTTGCTVLYNDSDVVDANGLPPHSIEVIALQPGNTSDDDQALADLILKSKAAGIQTYSGNSTSKVVIDGQGNSETVFYTRPTATTIYVAITVVTDPKITVNAAQIQAALVNYAAGIPGVIAGKYQPGVEVFALALEAQAFTVPGVLDISAFAVGTAPGPTLHANIPINVRHQAVLSTGNIAVTIT